MKNKTFSLSSLVLALFLAAGISSCSSPGEAARGARRSEKAIETARETNDLLSSRRFSFVPRRALAQVPKYEYIDLTSYYELTVTPDSIISLLPYFGKAYSNMYDRPDRLSPLDFESTDFTYGQAGMPVGKEKAVIDIRTLETSNGIQYCMKLEVYDNKSATLTVSAPMSTNLVFTGEITPIPAENPFVK